ncbi:TIM barrel protein [Natronobacterium texcoconense]|uniref:Xylose isomerase-like TIM barrel n=1 Tax=Natronobacterium texcoconense TaxID=1095778 RepID=A0A1H1IX46_NATTX|nr:TIM barrel protein [Natronobacterium texcoconense]SDR41946.1 Xylose isomerase-like TIM barrel [Natronobacterium texcoconense]
MSTTSSPDQPSPIECCDQTDVTPVSIDAAALESTAPGYLRDLKRELAEANLSPTSLTINACFEEDCSLATQEEVDRIRSHVRAGAFLGVGSVVVSVDDVENPEKVRPALAACAERAQREGIVLELEGPITLEE